jgi:polysaccharide biosynthesis protein PslH
VRVLFLSQRIPFPPNRGDKILTWRVIERLKRKHEVIVIAFAHDDKDVEAAEQLEAKGFPTIAIAHHHRRSMIRSLPLLLTKEPLTLGVYGSRRLQREVDRRVPSIDLIYAFSSSMGAFMLPHTRPARVMHFAELDSDKWRQYAEREAIPKRWIYRREHKTLFDFEVKLAHAVDENVFVTPLEEHIFQKLIPGAPSSVVENGVDLEYYRPSPGTAVDGEMVFVGVMDYLPNVDGCVFFVKEVLPKIRQRFPEARFTIVGAHPTPEVKALASMPGVTVTGFVDDTRDYLKKASISVSPLRIARGIQNKVLEAMAMGLPVVGTTSATQGIAGTPGEHYLVADGAESQAETLCALLADRERRSRLGESARLYVEAHHDWEKNFAGIDGIVERAIERRRRRAA